MDALSQIFAKKIKEIRKSLGMTQEQFANHIGVQRTTVNSWEREHRMPDSPTLNRVAEKLDVPIDELIGKNDVDPMPDETRYLLRSALEKFYKQNLDESYELKSQVQALKKQNELLESEVKGWRLEYIETNSKYERALGRVRALEFYLDQHTNNDKAIKLIGEFIASKPPLFKEIFRSLIMASPEQLNLTVSQFKILKEKHPEEAQQIIETFQKLLSRIQTFLKAIVD